MQMHAYLCCRDKHQIGYLIIIIQINTIQFNTSTLDVATSFALGYGGQNFLFHEKLIGFTS